MRKEVLILSAAIFLAGTSAARAQSCATPPSCASLGYTMTTSACSGQPTLVCPFDSSAVFCAGSSSGSGGSSGGSSGLLESCDGDCVKINGLTYKYKMAYNSNSRKYAYDCTSSCGDMNMRIPLMNEIIDLCHRGLLPVPYNQYLLYDENAGVYQVMTCNGYRNVSYLAEISGMNAYASDCVCVKEI